MVHIIISEIFPSLYRSDFKTLYRVKNANIGQINTPNRNVVISIKIIIKTATFSKF